MGSGVVNKRVPEVGKWQIMEGGLSYAVEIVVEKYHTEKDDLDDVMYAVMNGN